eukprot:GABW01002001.1.p2 GENE.GABW01002001.1~~GABW01002001.1.p2  ORF type:complete len:50 (-),score=27.01 GABW01002001.1:3-152(-)
MIPLADYVFGNETEAATLGRVMEWGEDLSVIAQKLANMEKSDENIPHST